LKLLFLLFVAFFAYMLWQWLKERYSQEGRPFAVKALLVGAALLLVALTLFGRVHWVGAAAATLLASLRFLLPHIIRYLPAFINFQKARAQTQEPGQEQSDAASSIKNIDEDTALAILGLEKPYTKESVIHAHKRMIQGLHPDKGGSDFLAAQINAAKTCLLKVLKDNESA